MKLTRSKCNSIQGSGRPNLCKGKIIFRNLEQARLRHKTHRSQSPTENTQLDLYQCKRSQNKLQRHIQVNEQALRVALAEAQWNSMKQQLSASHYNGALSTTNKKSANFVFPMKKRNNNYNGGALTPTYSKKQVKLIKLAITTTEELSKNRTRIAIKSTKNITSHFNKENYKQTHNKHKRVIGVFPPEEMKESRLNEMVLTLTTVDENYTENLISHPKASKVPKFITKNLITNC